MREHRDLELLEQTLRERARRDARSCLTCGRALQHVPRVGESVLLHSGKVRVAGTRLRERGLRGAGRG